MLHIIGAFAEFEASLCRERVRSGLAAAKSRGVKLGRRRTHDYQYITQLRREGLTYREIGGRLGVSQGTISTALRAARKTPEDSRS
jgi:DNA invertase Pin-like site-specific DNA recombinase